MGRLFNKAQRIALFHLAGKHCKQCGKELEGGFHAVMPIPWSKGGATDVTNGRALCAKCNLMKGDKQMISESHALRNWQKEAKQATLSLFNQNQSSVLVSATMGAGKTECAIAIAAELMNRAIERVVVVTTSKSLLG